MGVTQFLRRIYILHVYKKKIGAASADSSGPSLRLLRGVKAAGGAEGARRLDALARRLPAERAALEAVAAAGVAEARQWRAAAVEQASAVVSLGEVRSPHAREVCKISGNFREFWYHS